MQRLVLYFVAGLSVPAAFAQTVDFARDVQPLLQKRCQGCHNERQQSGGLRLDEPAAALRGGSSGTAIQPGKAEQSHLIQRVSSNKKGFAMPPVGAPLTPAEVTVLRAWIDQGAKWPREAVAAKTEANLHWSYRPVRRPAVPDVRQRAWVRNPIDAFVLAKLESRNVAPSLEAAKPTLIRRLSLDLTGLPLSPAEVQEFLSDNRPDAYERLVDRLLASPHYGERWARPWLDLAHYADSDGYEKDQVRPHAWRYRHWLIDALNRDMPFDQFTIEQLAGDLLPNATTEQRVATGFLRNTLTNREAGVDRAEARFEQVLNRTNTVGTTWMGLTVGCAQCHNHKYDAISQKEYYQLFSFFDRSMEENIPAPLAGEFGPYLQARPEYDRQRQELLAKYNVPAAQAEWETKMRQAYQHPGENLEWDFSVTSFRAMVDEAARLLMTDAAQRTQAQRDRLTEYFLSNLGPDFNRDKERSAPLKEARDKLRALNETLPALTLAQTIIEDPQATPTHLRVKGDYKSLGQEVQPGTLNVLPPLPEGAPRNRLTLARWIVARDNPLTPRVTVNRLWQELFGRGLVRTSEDFGTQGEKPSHPELLDWLASEFLDRGYSQKQMIRTIVLSATYRQSSKARPELATQDPENALLSRQNRLRLPAELIRDEALAVSGLLDMNVGGKSVRPPQPAGVAELGYANSVKWVESKGPERYRRGLYIHFQRTTPYPMLMNFDAPDSNVTCTRRRVSDTPLQALNLLNDPVFLEAAQAFTYRVLREASTDTEARLQHAFLLSTGREPNPRERRSLATLYERQAAWAKREPAAARDLMPLPPEGVPLEQAAALTGVSRVLLNLDEFITRE